MPCSAIMYRTMIGIRHTRCAFSGRPQTLLQSSNKLSLCRRRQPPQQRRSLTVATASTTEQQYQRDTRPPIVIIGGGPTGLLLSNLLSLHGVPSVLLEAQSVECRFKHPQAHFLNTRTMEILQHCMPGIHEKVLEAMPPVNQWNTFRFTHNMSATNPLAQVVHPVDLPVMADVDANGVLQQDAQEARICNKSHNPPVGALSSCTVGHLAQHTFCRILHNAAVQNAAPNTRLLYGTAVTRVHRDGPSNQLTIDTATGQSFVASVCVAADGANSIARQQETIKMRGHEGIQHLINIHVTLSPQQAAALHDGNNHAMLYFILNQTVVATVVCHSTGEYIVQIPYFPPYQTLERDFGPKQVDTMLQTIFGQAVSDWQVQSVNTWTMSSLIADQYCSTSKSLCLVGDAAHVFPPAGGFGMNTGLQDVHNLAWKLAWVFHNDRSDEDLKAVLESYATERRPVAQQNAALSLRNYHRLLKVTKSCYLNEQHPTLLRRLLDASPLPLVARQAIFQSLLQTALYPLSWLQQPDSMYAKHIQSSLRRVLQTGAGLPLLFPQFEVGFEYPPMLQESRDDCSTDWRHDTIMSEPTIQVGKLLPHAEVRVVSRSREYPNLHYLSSTSSNKTITTSDLPAQLSNDGNKLPMFVVACVGALDDPSIVEETCQGVSKRVGLPVVSVQIDQESSIGCSPMQGVALSLFSDGPAFNFPRTTGGPYLILVRPDGHIAGIATDVDDKEALGQQFGDEAMASLLSQASNLN